MELEGINVRTAKRCGKLVLTTTSTANIIGCSTQTIRRAVREGRFPLSPVRSPVSGRIMGFALDDVVAFVGSEAFADA